MTPSNPRRSQEAQAPGRGRVTRYRIIEQAARLWSESGSAEPSVAEIALAAGVFPNQITYHFGSKDALLVHAAFLRLLHDAKRFESIGEAARDAAAFRRNIARVIHAAPSLPLVARALAAGITTPELGSVIDTHLRILFHQSEYYLRRIANRRGWKLERHIETEVRTFWSAALGAVLLSHAGVGGTSADLDLAGVLTVHGQQPQ
jgi:AcrR family transcriptional regulator